jgi:hypothetical protein
MGADYNNFHLRLGERYARGENALFDEEVLTANKIPYPPLFHLFLALLIKVHLITIGGIFMQIVIYPLVLFIPAFLVYKHKGLLPAAITLLLLASSVAYFDRNQVTPQAIDLLLFPLAIYFFLEGKKWPTIILLTIIGYTHGAYSFLLILALLIITLLWKEKRSWIITIFLLCLPILILSVAFLPSALKESLRDNTLQETDIKDPFYAVAYAGLPLCLFIIPAIVIILRTTKDKLDKISLSWLLCLLPLLVFYPDRFASYAAPPAAILIASAFTKKEVPLSPTALNVLLLLLFVAAIIAVFIPFFLIAQGGLGWTLEH